VNVFMWRTTSTEDTPLALTSKNGYNLLLWNKSGVTYWAVSDLDARELRRLQNQPISILRKRANDHVSIADQNSIRHKCQTARCRSSSIRIVSK
jgi:hypothetical protein